VGRGQAATIGDTKTNVNGYTYEKTADRSWVAQHILVMEKHLGRRLAPGEYVSFNEGAPRTPALLENLTLRRRGDARRTNRSRIAQIRARIAELQAELELLLEEDKANA
jgi:hypothetical protein